LIVHLPDEFGEDVLHRKVEPDGRRPTEHPVLIDPGSLLAEILGVTEITVVSWHHQAARDVPAGWRMVAQAPDGVIEAIEHTDHPWAISVQWHPELAPEDPFQQRLMRALVEASHAHRLKQPGIPFS
jgi:putative glutamine amidotransferase